MIVVYLILNIVSNTSTTNNSTNDAIKNQHRNKRSHSDILTDNDVDHKATFHLYRFIAS